jgi:endogenous inhibitor of DNA gyrase (YacG/DUF329 family)
MSKAPACPICGKPVEEAFRPFCSRRCADLDLQRWLSGRYVIPAAEGDEDDDDDAGRIPRRSEDG